MKSKQRQPGPAASDVILHTCDPETLRWRAQEVQLAIARRAYELFEMGGGDHGHDREDWFRAESELLRPVSVSISESEDRVSVRANVLGFEETELGVSIEPDRITILGQKKTTATGTEGGKVEFIDWYPDQILQVVDLPTKVMPESAVVELEAGLLKFDLPKADVQKFEAASAA